MSDLIHYQRNMICLTVSEFDKLMKQREEDKKRITLLEDQLRITESELKSEREKNNS